MYIWRPRQGGGGGVLEIRMKLDRGRGVSCHFGCHFWHKLKMGLDWEEFDMEMCLPISILAQSGQIHVLAFLTQPSARLHRVLSMSSAILINVPWRGGGYRPKMMSKGQGGIWKLDNFGQGEGGGQKSRKFCGRHMYMAPFPSDWHHLQPIICL